MNRMELDRFVAEHGKEIKTTPAQDEVLKRKDDLIERIHRYGKL